MSLSSAQSNLRRTLNDLAGLVKKEGQLQAKFVDLSSKVNRAIESADKTKSASVLASKMREAERYGKDAAKVKIQISDVQKKAASKINDRDRYQKQVNDYEAKNRKISASEITQLQRDQDKLSRQLKQSVNASKVRHKRSDTDVHYDVFVSHASEDKKAVAEPLVNALKDRGISVWYDRFQLAWGDSLRQKIDQGLSASRFGIVILSKHFFEKDWPQSELDGLHSLEQGGATRILPIWHEITKTEVTKFSPTIGGRLALNTTVYDVEEIADELLKVLKSDG